MKNEEMKGVIVLLFANKQDLNSKKVTSVEEVSEFFQIPDYSLNSKVHVQGLCAITGYVSL
jgi:hypothetical protein